MAFSFFTQEMAIDLGTANTIIFKDDKIVLDEPSIIALDSSGNVKAIGKQAKLMHDRTNPGIRTIRPLQNGVIADYEAAEKMIKGFIKMINDRKRTLFNPSLRIVIGIPSGSTDVEIRAVRDSTEQIGARDVYLIHESMAAALGVGIDVEAPHGSMIVDIGGGTTEIAVISLGGIVVKDSIHVGGDKFTHDIQDFMRSQNNIKVGEITAEQIKINIGAVTSELDADKEPAPYTVSGAQIATFRPITVDVTYQEIAHCLNNSVSTIEQAISSVLEQTPAELYSDIISGGIYLSGGGALLRGLDKRFKEKFNIPFHVAEDPLKAVARGTCLALKNIDHYPFLMR